MDANVEQETLIEHWLNQINLDFHFPKFENDSIKAFFMNMIEETLVTSESVNLFNEFSKSFLFSGSFMEGAAFIRNINPNLPRNFFEVEYDIMFPIAKVLKNKSKDVIVDLEYAKGFTWVRFDTCFVEWMAQEQPEKLLVEHLDGNTYINSNAVKASLHCTSVSGPDFLKYIKESIQGPSSNWEAVSDVDKVNDHVKAIDKDAMTEGSKILYKYLGFIKHASDNLERFHGHISSELTKLEELSKEKPESICILVVEELASVVLPTNRKKNNLLLQVYWLLLAFINEALFTIHIIGTAFTKHDIQEKLGMWGQYFLPLLSFPAKLNEGLHSYIKYLSNIMPQEILQKYKEDPMVALSYFIEKSLYCQPEEIKNLLHVLHRCEKVLIPRYCLFESICYNTNNKPKVSNTPDQFCLNIDNVPAITVEDWPWIAGEWVSRCRAWPPVSIVNDIVTKGCHIVPKPCTGQKANVLLDWRWSFSQAEMMIANARTKEMDLSYFLTKSIFYRYMKAVVHNGETLASYLIKTEMLWLCEEHEESWWSNRNIVNCVSVILNRLKDSFWDKCLAHYFIHDLNLFENIDHELVRYGQAILESICADPLICIQEVLELIIVYQPKRGGKTWSSVELKQAPEMPLVIAEFREAIKMREIKYRDNLFSMSLVKILKNMCEEKIAEVLPEAYKKSFSIPKENISKNSKIDFEFLLGKDLKEELEFTELFRITFEVGLAVFTSVYKV